MRQTNEKYIKRCNCIGYKPHIFVRNILIIIHYATSFKVNIWLDYFGSLNNSEKMSTIYFKYFGKLFLNIFVRPFFVFYAFCHGAYFILKTLYQNCWCPYLDQKTVGEAIFTYPVGPIQKYQPTRKAIPKQGWATPF